MPDGGASFFIAMAAVVGSTSVGVGVGVTVSLVIMAASIGFSAYQMTSMPDMPGYSSEVRGRAQVVRSAVTPRRIIYGKCMVSGPLAYAIVHDNPGMSDDEKLALGYIKDGPNSWIAP